jgi:cytochrome c5
VKTPEDEHPFARFNRERCEALGCKPCPFCGGLPRDKPNKRCWTIHCRMCHASTGNANSDESAAARWNRRVAEDGP